MLVAKPGLDGHDRGAKVVALALRDAGFEVIYSGLHQTVDGIVETAVQEDVDVVGLSILSGAHLPLAKKLVAHFQEIGQESPLLLIGGNIPEQDIPTLKALGIAAVFPTGSRFEEFVAFIHQNVAED